MDVSGQDELAILRGSSTSDTGLVADLLLLSSLARKRLAFILGSEVVLLPAFLHHSLLPVLTRDVNSLNHQHSKAALVKQELGGCWCWLSPCDSISVESVSSSTGLTHTMVLILFTSQSEVCLFSHKQQFHHGFISSLLRRPQLLVRLCLTSSSLQSIWVKLHLLWLSLPSMVRQWLICHRPLFRTIDGGMEGILFLKPNVLILLGLGFYGPIANFYCWVLEIVPILIELNYILILKTFMHVYALKLGLFGVLLLTFTSLSDNLHRIRESMLLPPPLKRVIILAWVYPFQRPFSLYENFQVMLKRILDGFLQVASSWSIFEDCSMSRIELHDRIERVTSMFFEYLSLSYALNIVIRVVFYTSTKMVWGTM